MKRFFKNRFLVLIVSVIIISGIYIAVQRAIDNNFFRKNGDIISNSDTEVFGNTDSSADNFTSSNNYTVTDTKDLITGNNDDNSETERSITDNNDAEILNGEGLNSDEKNALQSDNPEGLEKENNNGNLNNGEDKSSKMYIYITGEVNSPRCCCFERRKQNC